MGNGGLELNDLPLWPKLIWDVKLSIKIAPTGPYQQCIQLHRLFVALVQWATTSSE